MQPVDTTDLVATETRTRVPLDVRFNMLSPRKIIFAHIHFVAPKPSTRLPVPGFLFALTGALDHAQVGTHFHTCL
jgi:hypothetical protein